MMKALLLPCLLAVIAPVTLGYLIVGGDESKAHSRPYQAAIFDGAKDDYPYFYCGGTLISEEWVVSAAHCSYYYVYVGAGYHDKTYHDGVNQALIRGTWVTHPYFNSQTLDNDIALIKLDVPLTFNKDVKPISISSNEPGLGDRLLVSGWGAEYSGDPSLPSNLREVTVDFMDYSECNKAYGYGLTRNMFCAGISGGGKDACQGDSGGPIVTEGVDTASTYLKGIVSWGYGCASAAYPGVYTNIANYCDWIEKNTGVRCL